MSDDELRIKICKHFSFLECQCCGYTLTLAEKENGNIFCFDCVNESHNVNVNPFDFDTNNGDFNDETE